MSTPLSTEEVEQVIDEAIDKLPADIIAAIEDVQIFVAKSRRDIDTLREAVTASGQSKVEIPQDFRAVFLGEPLPPDSGDDESDDPETVTGVFLFNAEKLHSAEDVIYTLWHEIGHALGLSEDEVTALGLG